MQREQMEDLFLGGCLLAADGHAALHLVAGYQAVAGESEVDSLPAYASVQNGRPIRFDGIHRIRCSFIIGIYKVSKNLLAFLYTAPLQMSRSI